VTHSLAGQHALVTGASSGIGRAIARALAEAGAAVAINYHGGHDAAETLAHEISRAGGRALVVGGNIASEPHVADIFDRAVDHFGTLDIVVANAGIQRDAPIGTLSLDQWNEVLAVNLTGQFLCAQKAIPLLKASANASIANLSSAAGRFGFPNRTPYAAAKWGVIGLTKSLSIELGPFGIRVNAICPGSVAGARIDSVYANKAKLRGVAPEVVRDEALAKTSLRRLVSADDIAHAIVFLASPLGANISGQALPVDADAQSLV